MKKYIIGIAIIALITLSIIIAAATEPVAAEPVVAEPNNFHISYRENGEWKEQDLAYADFGTTIQVNADHGTGVHVGICQNYGFSLNEVIFVAYDEDGSVKAEVKEDMGNVWLYLQAGQSGIATINCGDELNPEWVMFKIETVVE